MALLLCKADGCRVYVDHPHIGGRAIQGRRGDLYCGLHAAAFASAAPPPIPVPHPVPSTTPEPEAPPPPPPTPAPPPGDLSCHGFSSGCYSGPVAEDIACGDGTRIRATLAKCFEDVTAEPSKWSRGDFVYYSEGKHHSGLGLDGSRVIRQKGYAKDQLGKIKRRIELNEKDKRGEASDAEQAERDALGRETEGHGTHDVDANDLSEAGFGPWRRYRIKDACREHFTCRALGGPLGVG